MEERPTYGAKGTTPAPQTQQKAVATHKVFDEEIIKKVSAYIKEKEEQGLVIPPDYSVTNALAMAKLHLLDLRDDSGKLVVEQCTIPSVVNALTDMVLSGYNISKKHCAFIKYGDKLLCQPEYFGNLMTAKRDAGVKEVNGQCIYQGDEFIYEVDTSNGRKKLVKHVPKLENQDINKIKGAYAVVVYDDNTTKLEIMTIDQIRRSWEMGAAKGKSKAHTNFTDQQCLKTVMNRAVKIDINSSDDSEVLGEQDDLPKQFRDKNVQEKVGKKEIKTEDVPYEEVGDTAKTPLTPKEATPEPQGQPAGNGELPLEGPGY